MPDSTIHFLSPKLKAGSHPAKGNLGIFAREAIQANELLVVWGGRIVAGKALDELSPSLRSHSIQVEEDHYLVPSREDEEADFFNHSCEPNAVLNGQITLVALRDITAGEEVCFDYATCDGSPYDEFECGCGTLSCRKRISGEDWRRPELWERYAGHFSPYLQRRIDRIQVAGRDQEVQASEAPSAIPRGSSRGSRSRNGRRPGRIF
ncbi:MAG TPA: SET domain-containing protein [Anaerolineaceae bacterium]|nr:SET domain-containing protein [Anaerolineaceae bacterium]